jgi:hypothetical protein
VSKKIEYPHSVHVACANWGSMDVRGSADAATSVAARGSERGPAAAPLASKLSVALQMGQTRGPAFLLFKCAANLAFLLVSSTTSPFLRTDDGRSLACSPPSRHPEPGPRLGWATYNALWAARRALGAQPVAPGILEIGPNCARHAASALLESRPTPQRAAFSPFRRPPASADRHFSLPNNVGPAASSPAVRGAPHALGPVEADPG